MNIYVRRLFLYVFAAWLIVGIAALYPQPVCSDQLPEGVEVVSRGLPLPFYYSGTSVFTGTIPAQVSMGFLLVDLFSWFIIVVVCHYFYRKFMHE